MFIIVLAVVIVLLGVFAAIAATFFPRDALIFIMGEERFTRRMFRGTIEGFSGFLINQLPDMFDGDMEIDVGELMLTVSLDAASEPGAIEQLGNDFGFLNADILRNLGLLATSNVNISALYDISGQSPLLDINSSLSVVGHDSSKEEILNLEAVAIDNTVYVRLRQILERYIAVNPDDFGFDLTSMGDNSNILNTINLILNRIRFSDINRMTDFIVDNELKINAMISDSARAFLSSFDNMRVDRNVSVSVGNETVNLHRAVITVDYEDVLLAMVDVLGMIRDNDAYSTLLFDAMRTFDSHFNNTYREFLEKLDSRIESLKSDADRYSDDDDYIDFYLYINRANRIAGFGFENLEDESSLNFVVIVDIGYDLAYNFDNTYVRLHGSWDNSGHTTTGDMHIIFNHNSFLQREEFALEGKLLDFEISSDFVAINMSGEDMSWQTGDNMLLDAQIVDLMKNLELAFVVTFSDTEPNISLDARLLRPEISLKLLASHRQLDYVTITAPLSSEILNINLPAIMRGNVFAMLPHVGTFMEIYRNLIDFAES
jgi:hypothetical protein